MRNEFASSIAKLGKKDDRLVFLTGDLGYNALEPVKDVMGDRFINVGVAEQNMVGLAAGLASQGMRPVVYSIAPFAIYRPFEQLRNDICYHGLPVLVVGNGGGVAYGPMGFTHHALEDYGLVSMLPNMRALVPAFAEDIEAILTDAFETNGPKYLRLGRSLLRKTCAGKCLPAEKVLVGNPEAVAIGVGTITNVLQQQLADCLESERPELWVVNEPFAPLPQSLHAKIASSKVLITVEEHVRRGSFAEYINSDLVRRKALPSQVRNLTYESSTFAVGSENYIRTNNGFSADALADLCNFSTME